MCTICTNTICNIDSLWMFSLTLKSWIFSFMIIHSINSKISLYWFKYSILISEKNYVKWLIERIFCSFVKCGQVKKLVWNCCTDYRALVFTMLILLNFIFVFIIYFKSSNSRNFFPIIFWAPASYMGMDSSNICLEKGYNNQLVKSPDISELTGVEACKIHLVRFCIISVWWYITA